MIRAGEFFREIALMQNSPPDASAIASQGMRCPGIQRTELLRIVTHNCGVALEIERAGPEQPGVRHFR